MKWGLPVPHQGEQADSGMAAATTPPLLQAITFPNGPKLIIVARHYTYSYYLPIPTKLEGGVASGLHSLTKASFSI